MKVLSSLYMQKKQTKSEDRWQPPLSNLEVRKSKCLLARVKRRRKDASTIFCIFIRPSLSEMLQRFLAFLSDLIKMQKHRWSTSDKNCFLSDLLQLGTIALQRCRDTSRGDSDPGRVACTHTHTQTKTWPWTTSVCALTLLVYKALRY